MSVISKIKDQYRRRVLRVRKNLRKAHDNDKLRVSVYRSLNYTSAQVVDDVRGKTLFSVTTKNIAGTVGQEKKNKTELAYQAGILLGAKLLENDHKDIIFDRGAYLYHGRVKALADGIRAAGIIF